MLTHDVSNSSHSRRGGTGRGGGHGKVFERVATALSTVETTSPP